MMGKFSLSGHMKFMGVWAFSYRLSVWQKKKKNLFQFRVRCTGQYPFHWNLPALSFSSYTFPLSTGRGLNPSSGKLPRGPGAPFCFNPESQTSCPNLKNTHYTL